MVESGHISNTELFLGLLAQLESEAVHVDSALVRLDEAFALSDQVESRYHLAFLHRCPGDLLLKRDPPEPSLAEEAFRAAIAVAKEQGARSYHLQAALPLAKLYQSTSRPVEAHAVLAPALEGFSPTPEMPEIAEAKVLLAALAETDKVQAAEAQWRRRGQLQVAYGNALIGTRGHHALETMEAFAKARQSAGGDADAPERLAADFGLWVGSYVRGELSAMRAHSSSFLEDVAARPDSPEAGVAHRAAGVTHWYAGEYREAREHLERALALFEPGRDDDLAFRFGHDAGVVALLCLAIVLWPLGDVERAIALVERAQGRMEHIPHVVTRTVAKMHGSMFELLRGDFSRAESSISELNRHIREHGLHSGHGEFLAGWAKSLSGAPAEGLKDMRRAAESLREEPALNFDGLMKIAHAQVAGRAGESARAIAIVDDGLEVSDRIGHRAFDAELHRVRGELFAQRDATNRTSAEEAFRTAIAIAREQETRSFELRAAPSLARLHQSTGRSASAHAVLAPALEGFTPTPEMPEIAEAQALLGQLSDPRAGKECFSRRESMTALVVANCKGRWIPSAVCAAGPLAAAYRSSRSDAFAVCFRDGRSRRNPTPSAKSASRAYRPFKGPISKGSSGLKLPFGTPLRNDRHLRMVVAHA
jgi:predicted ATPase